MKSVLLCHNHYLRPGGEDRVFALEGTLLERGGLAVFRHTVHNTNLRRKLAVSQLLATAWNQSRYRELRGILKRCNPDLVHFHNTFALLSPSAYHAAKSESLPVVKTLHNFRLTCPGGVLARNGRVCTECVGKTIPLSAILHRCYQDSAARSAAVGLVSLVQRAMKTWIQAIDVFVALTEFSRARFVEAGLPAARIAVKPNFVAPDPGAGTTARTSALFVGRLSVEKGIGTMLAAWRSLPHIPLWIAGDGPLELEVARAASNGLRGVVTRLGSVAHRSVVQVMQNARFLIMPSECYEGFPLTIAEAFACGTPVIASRLGAMQEIIDDGRTGLLFEAGNPEDLAAKVEWAWTHPGRMAEMGGEARREYELKYTADRNFELLMDIYQRAIEINRGRR